MPPLAFWNKRERGRQGEDDALAYLLLQGLVLLERNYLCKGGELDLIMRDGTAIVFVEVRLRSSAAFGGALASITPAKQRRMVVAAQSWLQGKKTLPPCRFDALAIDGGHISWLKNILDM
jgi:putative endonuclease